MKPTWSDLANGPRWRGVVSFVHDWVGPFDAKQGMAWEDLNEILDAKSLNLPVAIREWYVLAANWDQGGLAVWIPPQELAASDGMVWILTDMEGITQWGIQVLDFEIEDPPVFSLEEGPSEFDFPSFTSFVAAMIASDVIFDYSTEEPIELEPSSVRADLTCLVSGRCGDVYADAALDSATVVAFAYPRGGPAYGRSRTPAGHALLQRLRLQPQ